MKGYLVLIERFVFNLTQKEVYEAIEKDTEKGIASDNYYKQGETKKKAAIRDWAVVQIRGVEIPGVEIMPLIDDARIDLVIGDGA